MRGFPRRERTADKRLSADADLDLIAPAKRRNSLWVSVRCVVRELLVPLGRRKKELDEARSALSALRWALEDARSEIQVSEVMLHAYRLRDDLLRRCIDELALPALRRCEGECSDANKARPKLEAQIPVPVDEEYVRTQATEGRL